MLEDGQQMILLCDGVLERHMQPGGLLGLGGVAQTLANTPTPRLRRR